MVADSAFFPSAVPVGLPAPARSLHRPGRGCRPAAARHMQKMEVARLRRRGGEACALPAARALAPRARTRPAAAAPPGSPSPVPAGPAPPAPRAPRPPRPAPPAGRASPLGAPSASQAGFQAPHRSPAPSPLPPGSAEGPALGLGAPGLRWAGDQPRRRVYGRVRARGQSASQPRPAARSGSRGGPAASPTPSCPRSPLSLALSCRWAARGDSGPPAAKGFPSANSPESGESALGTDGAQGLGEGQEQGAAEGSPLGGGSQRLGRGGGGPTWRRAGWGETRRSLNILRKGGRGSKVN